MRIKALSLWEPWATLMWNGAKTIETRSWSTSYRGPLLICAAQRRSDGELRKWLAENPQLAVGLGFDGPPALHQVIARLHFGRAVVIVDLVGCRSTDLLRRLAPDADELAFGDFSPGRWGWETAHRRVIDPFPVRGRQGLFEVELPPGVGP